MVDVRLVYPPDKFEAAARLAEAIESAGYAVEREALPDSRTFPDFAAEAGKARALLLIWSRELVSAAMVGERLGEARRHSNLVEISADGIEPVAGPEGSPVVLLCGWRGQPFHPGWQRILADVERLCGSRDASGKRRGDAPGAPGLGLGNATRRSGPARPSVRAAVAAGALIAATLGAAAAFQQDAPDAAPPAQTRLVVADPGPSPGAAGEGTTAADVSPAPVEVGARASAGDAFPAAPAAVTTENAPAPAPSASRAAVRKAATPQRSGAKRLAVASQREVKRYSRKHSKTMRLFCQRSGRSTPQCRTFARSTRNLGG